MSKDIRKDASTPPQSLRPLVLTMLNREEQLTATSRRQSSFEFLVRHLLTRLLVSESLGGGEEAMTRVPQIAAAAAMPGVVLAIFLYPLYHYPYAPRAFWSQVSDHLFYTIYSFIAMGLGTVLQWDLLFPDRIDALVLTVLPISNVRLLLARVMALTIFLGSILLGTNLLGILAMPISADLLHIGLTHFAAHAAAVLLSGLAVAAFLVGLQGLFVCALGERFAQRLSPLIHTLCVLLLLTMLFLYPLLAHFLQPILQSRSSALLWFPPFWFLGVYERILWGPSAPVIFGTLAQIGLIATLVSVALALLSYPLAFRRRTRQIIAGTTVNNLYSSPRFFLQLLHRTLLLHLRQRAIYHWISQTLLRVQRTRLLLAIFGGLTLATVIGSILLIHVGEQTTRFALSPLGLRFAVPIVAFWAVAGFRTAMRVPVALSAAWIFSAIHGSPAWTHLFAAELWVMVHACLTTVTVTVLLQIFVLPIFFDLTLWTQILIAIALPVLLTDLLFFTERSIPFTVERPYSVSDLSWIVAMYLGFFPAFCSTVITVEPWIESNFTHLVFIVTVALAIHLILRHYRIRFLEEHASREGIFDGHLAPGEIGLRD